MNPEIMFTEGRHLGYVDDDISELRCLKKQSKCHLGAVPLNCQKKHGRLCVIIHSCYRQIVKFCPWTWKYRDLHQHTLV